MASLFREFRTILMTSSVYAGSSLTSLSFVVGGAGSSRVWRRCVTSAGQLVVRGSVQNSPDVYQFLVGGSISLLRTGTSRRQEIISRYSTPSVGTISDGDLVSSKVRLMVLFFNI